MRTVEDPEFRRFVHMLYPQLQVPGRKTIGRCVDKLYAAAVELVSEMLQLTE